MRRLAQVAAAIGLAAACLAGSVPASFAARAEGWVQVEFKFKAGGKTTAVVIDLPVQDEKDAISYCSRYLSVGEKSLAEIVQQDRADLAKARFTGARCLTEGGKIKLVSNPTNRLPKVKLPPPPQVDPTVLSSSRPVTYLVDLVYEKIVDGPRPRKVLRTPMHAVNARAAVEMCGSPKNMLRLSKNAVKKTPFIFGNESWVPAGGTCVTGKNGYIELTVETSPEGSN